MSMTTRRRTKGSVKNRHYTTDGGYYAKPRLDKAERKKRLYFRYTKLAKPKARDEYINSVKHEFPDTRPLYVAISYPSYARVKDITVSMNNYFGTGKTENEFYTSNVVHAVSKRQNIIEEIYGFIRIGKSRLARAKIYAYARKMHRNVWFFWDIDDLDDNLYYELNGEWTEWINVYVTYSYSQTVTALMQLAIRFDWVLEDEIQKETGKNSLKTKWNLANVIKIAAGKRGLNLVFLTPDEKYITQVSFYNRVIAINEKDQRTLAFLSIPGESENELQALGPITICAHEDPAVTEAYEARSDEVKGRVQGTGGASTPTPRDTEALARTVVQAFNDLEKTDDDLLGNNKEYYLKDKNTAFMEFVALYCDDVYSNPNVDMIVNRAFHAIKNKGTDTDDREIGEPVDITKDDNTTDLDDTPVFTWTRERVERELRSRYADKDSVEWYLASKVFLGRGDLTALSQDQIVKEFHLRIGSQAVSDRFQKIKRWLETDGVGHAFERWFSSMLRKRDHDVLDLSKANDGVAWEGKSGKDKPDVIEYWSNGDITIWSCKTTALARGQVDERDNPIDPEWKRAIALQREPVQRKVDVIVALCNISTGGLSEKMIDLSTYTGGNFEMTIPR